MVKQSITKEPSAKAPAIIPTETGFYRTRLGRKARVTCLDAPGPNPLMGYIEGPKGSVTACTWTSSGKAAIQGNDLTDAWIDTRTATVDLYVMLDPMGAVIVSYTKPREGDGYIGIKHATVTVAEGDKL